LALVLHFFIKIHVKNFPLWIKETYGIDKVKGTFDISSKIFLAAFTILIIIPITLAYGIYHNSLSKHHGNFVSIEVD
jgi:hypothetical protein